MTPAWWRRDLYPGDEGPDVVALQSILGVYQTGVLDEATLARVRGLQAVAGLPIVDCVDDCTAAVAGERHRTLTGVPPTWFPAATGPAVARILGGTDGDTVRRFQSAHGLTPTGVVDEETAVALGD